MQKKRFVLFGFYHYYPCGGMGDYIVTFDTLEELMYLSKQDDTEYKFSCDKFQIFDTKYFKTGSGESPTQAFSDLSDK